MGYYISIYSTRLADVRAALGAADEKFKGALLKSRLYDCYAADSEEEFSVDFSMVIQSLLRISPSDYLVRQSEEPKRTPWLCLKEIFFPNNAKEDCVKTPFEKGVLTRESAPHYLYGLLVLCDMLGVWLDDHHGIYKAWTREMSAAEDYLVQNSVTIDGKGPISESWCLQELWKPLGFPDFSFLNDFPSVGAYDAGQVSRLNFAASALSLKSHPDHLGSPTEWGSARQIVDAFLMDLQFCAERGTDMVFSLH